MLQHLPSAQIAYTARKKIMWLSRQP